MYDYISLIRKDKFLFFIPSLTIATRLIIFLFIPFTFEDAYITFRYAENFANGFGLVYNIGERVYGTTTPIFAIMLGTFKLIGVPCVVSSLFINLLAEGMTSLIIYKILKDNSNRVIAAIISLIYVFSPSNISWSILGMETAFFTSVIALSFFSFYKKKYFLALFLGFLSAIIRIDGLSVTLVILISSLIEKKLSVFKMFLIPLTLFIGWLTLLYIYFGNFLPNAMIAKIIVYSYHQPSVLRNFKVIPEKFFIAGSYSSSILTIFFLIGAFLIFKRRNKLYPMIAWFFIYYLALILSKTNIFGWYLIPPLFVYITISGVAIIFVFSYLMRFFNWNQNLLHAFIFLCVMFFSTITLPSKINQISNEYKYQQNVRIRVGKYLNKYTPVNSTVFVEAIGAIGYYSDRYIYDDFALISPIFLELNKSSYNAESRYKKIKLVNPNYLVIRNKYLNEFYTKTRLLNEYSPIKVFEYHSDNPIFVPMTIFRRNK